MLVLTHKAAERTQLKCTDGTVIWVSVTKIKGGQVKLAFDAPPNVLIRREKVVESDEGSNGE